MNQDLSMIRSLRKVLESAGKGRGMARSVVEDLRGSGPPGMDSARMVLLGYPLRDSLRPLGETASEEVAMLASLIIEAPGSSAMLVGRSGEELAGTLEKWARARDNRKLEQRVLRFRGVITSGVLGAVTAMVASLGPLIGNLDFSGGAPGADPLTLLVGAAAMAAMSSAMLGAFMGGRGFLLNVGVTLVVFGLVSSVASPLARVPTVVAWGVK